VVLPNNYQSKAKDDWCRWNFFQGGFGPEKFETFNYVLGCEFRCLYAVIFVAPIYS
jgi:hypothetical protein